MEAVSRPPNLSRFEQLRLAREIIRAEGDAVLTLAGRLPDRFCDAVELLTSCRGRVVVTGMGKAGLIGQKLVATFSSTGTSSHFLHPAEAIHGDLGCIQPRDVVLALSYSGETEELVRLLPALRQQQSPLIAITASERSSLGRIATVTLALGSLREACPLGLAPTTSTTVMLALGDALALVLSQLRHFTADDFARYHPGGNLGRKLARVDEVMRPLAECRTALQTQSVRDVLVTASKPGRRTGAIMLVDERGQLTGLFTDSDLARLLEARNEAALDQPIRAVMTRSPTTIVAGSPMPTAVELLAHRRISELPVVDGQGKPVGLIDITDVVAWLPSPPIGTSGAEPHSGNAPPTVPFPNLSRGWSRT